MREDVSHRIKEIVLEIWPTAKVEIVGSTRTNLFLPTRFEFCYFLLLLSVILTLQSLECIL
jgi:hypothetical protein